MNNKGIEQMKGWFETPAGKQWVERNITKRIEEAAKRLQAHRQGFPHHLIGGARRKEEQDGSD